MNTDYKKFCELRKEKISNDKDIAENEIDANIDLRKRISFRLNVHEYLPRIITNYYHGIPLFELDDEDLEYFYNKYSKKLRDEMNEKIDSIKKDYKDYVNE